VNQYLCAVTGKPESDRATNARRRTRDQGALVFEAVSGSFAGHLLEEFQEHR
jgi:hypothetical protein